MGVNLIGHGLFIIVLLECCVAAQSQYLNISSHLLPPPPPPTPPLRGEGFHCTWRKSAVHCVSSKLHVTQKWEVTLPLTAHAAGARGIKFLAHNYDLVIVEYMGNQLIFETIHSTKEHIQLQVEDETGDREHLCVSAQSQSTSFCID